jgi:hypothetical protein
LKSRGNVLYVVDVFISHSREDLRLVSQVVDLLRTSLNLSAQQIRCTSLDGYRLPAGADTDEKKEVFHEQEHAVDGSDYDDGSPPALGGRGYAGSG